MFNSPVSCRIPAHAGEKIRTRHLSLRENQVGMRSFTLVLADAASAYADSSHPGLEGRFADAAVNVVISNLISNAISQYLRYWKHLCHRAVLPRVARDLGASGRLFQEIDK